MKRTAAVDFQFWRDGGAEGVRTPDLLNAIQALYQLSYDPDQSGQKVVGHQKLSKSKWFLNDF